MSARALAVLDRFPQHLGATDPGKRFGVVVGGIVDLLDVLTGQVGEVRRSHRIEEAPARTDLLALAALHGLGTDALSPVGTRLGAIAAVGSAEQPDVATVEGLLGLAPGTLLDATTEQLVALTAAPGRHASRQALERTVVLGAVAAHAVGNGTARSLLVAAAAYLGLAVEEVTHTEERWWHLARCRDRIRVGPPVAGADAPQPEPDVLGLEENPFRAADLEPAPKRHGEAFHVLRGGLEDVPATVRVRGVGARTVRPLVVDVDAGAGVAFDGSVPDGVELRFESSGRVVLDGADVTGSAWSFTGAVFASAAATLPGRDFVFADDDLAGGRPGTRAARFVTTAPPADALSPGTAMPHGAASVGPLTLPLGRSRWVAFVTVAHTVEAGRPAPTRTKEGRFGAAVFAQATSVDGVTAGDAVLDVGFAWEEREPFAVRVLLPRRLQAADDDAGSLLRQPLRILLDRHRAAGVDVRVEYADPRWTLGTGVIRDVPDEALGTVLAGTELWPDGTPEPV